MIPNLLLSRVSLPIVFLGSAIIIFAIKTTPLFLPAQYYFNFSKLLTGGAEPFLVAPPGVAAKKLCELLDKHEIPRDIFGRDITCREDTELSATQKRDRPTFSTDQLDKIYNLAFSFDTELRNLLRTAGPIPLAVLTNQELEEILTKQSTPRAAFTQILLHYTAQMSQLVHYPLTDALNARYGLKDGEPQPAAPPPPVPASRLTPDQRARIVAAHRAFALKFATVEALSASKPIRKSTVDQAVAAALGHADISPRIASYYSDAVSSALRVSLREAFTESGMVIGDEEQEKQLILREIARFSYGDYTISILVRLAPVFLFGLFVGMVVGRGEVTSVAVAAALAALLLCWPLVLMWDRLVEHAWMNKRSLFLLFYGVYIASFFFTARAGAIVGAGLRQRAGLSADLQADPAATHAITLTWRDVATSVVSAIVINAALYVWNAIIPLSNTGSN